MPSLALMFDDNELAFAEGDVVTIRAHVDRLPEGGFVKYRMEQALKGVEEDLKAAKSSEGLFRFIMRYISAPCSPCV